MPHHNQGIPNLLPEQRYNSFLLREAQGNALPGPTQDYFHPIPIQQSFLPEQGLINFLPRHEQGNAMPKQGQDNFLPEQEQNYQKMSTEQIISRIKSEGVFDQFRRECLADGDITPAYRNLSQRVEANVMTFLSKQTFTGNLNKLQLRERLRKNITESGFLEGGVGRIVDQVVDPKINTVFHPRVRDEIYKYFEEEKSATATDNLDLPGKFKDGNMPSSAIANINGKKKGEEHRKYLPNNPETTSKKSMEMMSGSEDDKHKLTNDHKARKDDKNKNKPHQNTSDKSNARVKSVSRHEFQKETIKRSNISKFSKNSDKERDKNQGRARNKPKEKSDKKSSEVINRELLIKEKDILRKDKTESDKTKSRENEKKYRTESKDKYKHDREKRTFTKHEDESVSFSKRDKYNSKDKLNKSEEYSIKDLDWSEVRHKHNSSTKSKPSSSCSKEKDKKCDGDSTSDKLKGKKAADGEMIDRRTTEKVSNDGCNKKDSTFDRNKVEQKTKSTSSNDTEVIKTRDKKAQTRNVYGIETRQTTKRKAAGIANKKSMDYDHKPGSAN